MLEVIAIKEMFTYRGLSNFQPGAEVTLLLALLHSCHFSLLSSLLTATNPAQCPRRWPARGATPQSVFRRKVVETC